jgi:sugar (pentulose or hexulose) kinase
VAIDEALECKVNGQKKVIAFNLSGHGHFDTPALATAAIAGASVAADELWLAGGATRSPVWPQILADVSGVPVVLAGDVSPGVERSGEADWAALGGAMLAGWGAGAFPTLEAAIEKLQPAVARVLPNPALAGLYADQLAAYQRISRAVSTAQAAH